MSEKVAPEKRPRGRPKVEGREPRSSVITRMPTALLDRIKAAVGGTGVAAFIREAVEAELKRRERGK